MRREWKRTRNPHLKVHWKQDALAPPGFGTLRTRSDVTKNYAFARVPRKVYRDMLTRPDPETMFGQLVTMYMEVD